MRTACRITTALLALAFATTLRGDAMFYDISQHAADTLKGLGNRFVIGCALLAVGIVIAAFVRRKN
jgi:hypothetical protein